MIKLKNLIESFDKNIDPTNTEEFKRWFGNSKVVKKDGTPLIVWKGMPVHDNDGRPITSIQRQSDFPAMHNDEPGIKIAGFFSSDPQVAKKFATITRRSQLLSAYLKIENPFVIDMKNDFSGHAQFGERGLAFRNAIRSGKYDGVIIYNTKDEGDVYVPLKANQIKATTNVGTFDPNNDEYNKE